MSSRPMFDPTTAHAFTLIRRLIVVMMAGLAITTVLGVLLVGSYFRLVHRANSLTRQVTVEQQVIDRQSAALADEEAAGQQRSAILVTLRAEAAAFAVVVDPNATTAQRQAALDRLRSLAAQPAP